MKIPSLQKNNKYKKFQLEKFIQNLNAPNNK